MPVLLLAQDFTVHSVRLQCMFLTQKQIINQFNSFFDAALLLHTHSAVCDSIECVGVS